MLTFSCIYLFILLTDKQYLIQETSTYTYAWASPFDDTQHMHDRRAEWRQGHAQFIRSQLSERTRERENVCCRVQRSRKEKRSGLTPPLKDLPSLNLY